VLYLKWEGGGGGGGGLEMNPYFKGDGATNRVDSGDLLNKSLNMSLKQGPCFVGIF